jgi:hypothetical protein
MSLRRDYQPRSNLVKDENGDLLADSHDNLSRWKNDFCELLNVHMVSDVRQIEIHNAEPLVPGPSPFEVEIATAKLKNYKSPCSDKFRQNWFQQEVKHYGLRSINSLILYDVRKNCLISGRSTLLYQFTRKAIKLTSNYRGISLLSTSYKILSNIFLSRLGPYVDEIIGDHQCGF